MCQVTPFTLPCCRRIYVQVDRLPSCPDGWPKKKCPEELCVQISGHVAKDVDHRNNGICWRCLAMAIGKVNKDREDLRPVLDKAFIVEGLNDVSMEERHRKMEKAGICWFCGACGDCASCGTGECQNAIDPGNRKGKRRMVEGDVGQGRNKMVKAEDARGSMPTLPCALSAVASTLPDLSSYPDQPFEEQLLDPALQRFHYKMKEFGYDQFRQPAAAFNYQSQEMPFQSPTSQHPSGSWQDIQGVQSHGVSVADDGSGHLDPSQDKSEAREDFKHPYDLTPQQDQELPPLPGFDTNWVDLEVNAMDDESFNQLLAEYNDLFEAQSIIHETNTPELKLSEEGQSQAPAKSEHPAGEASLADRSVAPPNTNTLPQADNI